MVRKIRWDESEIAAFPRRLAISSTSADAPVRILTIRIEDSVDG
jgi:hypothetical protein